MSREERQPILAKLSYPSVHNDCIQCFLESTSCLFSTPENFVLKRTRATYTNTEPAIAFRGSARVADDVFANGFSAYSFKRNLNHCNPTNGNLRASILCMMLCAPFIVLSFLMHCFDDNCIGCSLGQVTGHDQHITLYASNWSALALTLDPNSARGFTNEPGTDNHQYMLFLADGYYNYNQFCHDELIAKRGRKPIDTYESRGGAEACGEVFPNGTQRVLGDCVIGKYSFREGHYYVELNPGFRFHSEAKEVFKDSAGYDYNEFIAKISALKQHLKNQLAVDVQPAATVPSAASASL